jgi:hypothetical protein
VKSNHSICVVFQLSPGAGGGGATLVTETTGAPLGDGAPASEGRSPPQQADPSNEARATSAATHKKEDRVDLMTAERMGHQA